MSELNLRVSRPVGPTDAVKSLRHRRRNTRVLRSELLQLRREGRGEGRRVPVHAVESARHGDMNRELEAVRNVLRGLRVRHRRARIGVSGRANAFPQKDGAAGRACRDVLVEASGSASVAVVVLGHHDRGPMISGEVPEPRHRDAVPLHQGDQVDEEPLLLVGLRDPEVRGVDPVGLRVSRSGAVEEIARADSDRAVALLAGPRWVALSRVDDRAGQVEGERGRLPAARPDVMQGDGRVRRRSAGGCVQVRYGRSTVERVAVRRPVELKRRSGNPCTGLARGVHAQIGVRKRPAGVDEPEQTGELLVGPQRHQVPAGLHPVTERRDLRRRQRCLAEDDDVDPRERPRRELRDVEVLERRDPFGLEDLSHVGAERIRAGADDENRRRRQACRERPAHIGAEPVAGEVCDA